MIMDGVSIWFLGVLSLAVLVCCALAVLSRRAVEPAEAAVGNETSGGSVLVSPLSGRVGLLCSVLGLAVALYLNPAARYLSGYLPESAATPLGIYAILAFPFLLGSGVIFAVPGYISKQYYANLAAMVVAGLALAWLVISLLMRTAL